MLKMSKSSAGNEWKINVIDKKLWQRFVSDLEELILKRQELNFVGVQMVHGDIFIFWTTTWTFQGDNLAGLSACLLLPDEPVVPELLD